MRLNSKRKNIDQESNCETLSVLYTTSLRKSMDSSKIRPYFFIPREMGQKEEHKERWGKGLFDPDGADSRGPQMLPHTKTMKLYV